MSVWNDRVPHLIPHDRGIEAELWPMLDGLAVVLRPRGEPVTYAAQNGAWNGAFQAGLRESAFGGAPTDGPVDLALLDGSSAIAMCVLPVAWRHQRIGVLAALRTGPVADGDVATAATLAAPIALERVQENAFWRIQRVAAELEARIRAPSELHEIVRADRDPDSLLAGATGGLARISMPMVCRSC